MAGDVRDSVLGILRSQGKTWAAMSEAEQRLTADKAMSLGRQIAAQAALAVAGAGRDALAVTVAKFQVTDKGELKGEFLIGQPEETTLATLLDVRGRSAVLVSTDIAEYLGERESVQFDLDQKVLDLDEEEGDEFEDLGDIPEATERHPLVDQLVRTVGGNEGSVIFVYPQGERDELRTKLVTLDGAEIEGVVAEVLVPIEGSDPQAWNAEPVGPWLAAQAQPATDENLAAVEAAFAPSGVFEIGHDVIVPLSDDKTTEGSIIGRDEVGNVFTVKTRAGSELDVTFAELNAVNPPAAGDGSQPESGEPESKPKKSRKKPSAMEADGTAASI